MKPDFIVVSLRNNPDMSPNAVVCANACKLERTIDVTKTFRT